MDKKISQLTSLSAPASDDLLAIVDVSTSTTKKITVGAIIGDKYVRTTRFAIISSGTSGTITLPPSSEVILDDFGGTVDAVVSETSGGFPTLISAKSSTGAVIATSFDNSGNWSFTGTPATYPVAILYRVRQKILDFDSTASDIWGNSNVEQVTKSDIGLGNVPNIDATNPANIVQTSSYRFVTDTEKALWNASIDEAFETVSKNLKSKPFVLNYTTGLLTSIVYTVGVGQTITKTLNYTGGVLTSIVLSGDTPSGISLTKTLNYTGSSLTSVSYS